MLSQIKPVLVSAGKEIPGSRGAGLAGRLQGRGEGCTEVLGAKKDMNAGAVRKGRTANRGGQAGQDETVGGEGHSGDEGGVPACQVTRVSGSELV